jgi:putative cardiolipin synthase
MPGFGRLRLLAAATLLALAGCASLPDNVGRRESHAFADGPATTLGRVVAASAPDDAGDRSGLRLLPDADDALEARLALVRSAERSIDVQYYLIANDGTGRQFLAALVAAASRGVRVRVLVDDLYTAREDALFAALSGLPGFEVRLFNPLPARSGGFATRVALSSHQFARVNRRMHNKLLIADGSFAVTGGRNVADEYFDRGYANFIDLDLLSTGPVVATLAALFDEFWSSTWAYPASTLLRGGDAAARERATLLLQALGSAAAPAHERAGESDAPTLADEIAHGRVALRFAAARVVADSPDRIGDGDPAGDDGPVMRAHLELLARARSNVVVATPYFLPGAAGLSTLRAARERGVRLSVLTNSLATTDEPLVHFGYARYREGLLRLGVALHELIPTREAPASSAVDGNDRHGASIGRLHAKLVVVDERWVSVGSMNIDRRSARSNTESMIVIDDRGLAAEAIAFLDPGRTTGSYALRLAAGGRRIEWVAGDGGGVLRAEPTPFGGPGLKPRLASFFVSEELL